MLCSLDERVRLLLAGGAQRVLVLPFTLQISQLSPAAFVEDFLLALGAKAEDPSRTAMVEFIRGRCRELDAAK